MKVETYEVTEQTTEHRDNFEIEVEAEALIEELNLEGQRKLLGEPDPKTSTRERLPYHKMNQEEQQVYKHLFPEHVSLDSYDAGPIPVRVLQVASHAVDLFDEVEVWYPQTSNPDPLLVGLKEKDSGYGKHQYLLARWGSALAPFSELKEDAILTLMEEWTANAKEVIAEAKAFIAAPEALVRKKLSGTYVSRPWI